jgi:hypothetical protein
MVVNSKKIILLIIFFYKFLYKKFIEKYYIFFKINLLIN